MEHETVMVICAHNDDQSIGAGGTLAKYVKEGKRVITIIFSFGEIGSIHLQERVARRTRVKESRAADKVLGIQRTHFLGLAEGKFPEEARQKDMQTKIGNMIKKEKPTRIFTHAPDDPHRDHVAVYNFVMQLADSVNFKGDIYSFNIWNLFINFKKRHLPKMVVDVSGTFRTKVEACNKHRSQKVPLLVLMWNVYFQAIYYGLKYGMKYAEVFYKVR